MSRWVLGGFITTTAAAVAGTIAATTANATGAATIVTAIAAPCAGVAIGGYDLWWWVVDRIPLEPEQPFAKPYPYQCSKSISFRRLIAT